MHLQQYYSQQEELTAFLPAHVFPYVPPLSHDHLHLWHLDLEEDRHCLPGWRDYLSFEDELKAAYYPSEVELTSAERCEVEMTRESYLFYRAVLRYLLASYSARPVEAVRIQDAANGRPYLEVQQELVDNQVLCFSTSHSWQHALIAVTRQQSVGVDLQRCVDYGAFDIIAENRFSPTTLAAWRLEPPARQTVQFFRLWTLYEACFKYLGGSIAWQQLTLLLDPETGIVREFSLHPAEDVLLPASIVPPFALHTLDIDLPGYTMALACSSTITNWLVCHLR